MERNLIYKLEQTGDQVRVSQFDATRGPISFLRGAKSRTVYAMLPTLFKDCEKQLDYI
jgi:hypothetical protein